MNRLLSRHANPRLGCWASMAVLGSICGCCGPSTFEIQVDAAGLQGGSAALSIYFAPLGKAERFIKIKANDWFKDSGERDILIKELNDPEKRKHLFDTDAGVGRKVEIHRWGPLPEKVEKILIWAAPPGKLDSIPDSVDPAILGGSGFWPFCSGVAKLRIEVDRNGIKSGPGRDAP